MKRKLIASLLCLCMIVSLLPAAAFAGEERDATPATPSIYTMGFEAIGDTAKTAIERDLKAAKNANGVQNPSADIDKCAPNTMWVVFKDLTTSQDTDNYKLVVTGPNNTDLALNSDSADKVGPGTGFHTDTGYYAIYWTFSQDPGDAGGTVVSNTLTEGTYTFKLYTATAAATDKPITQSSITLEKKGETFSVKPEIAEAGFAWYGAAANEGFGADINSVRGTTTGYAAADADDQSMWAVFNGLTTGQKYTFQVKQGTTTVYATETFEAGRTNPAYIWSPLDGNNLTNPSIPVAGGTYTISLYTGDKAEGTAIATKDVVVQAYTAPTATATLLNDNKTIQVTLNKALRGEYKVELLTKADTPANVGSAVEKFLDGDDASKVITFTSANTLTAGTYTVKVSTRNTKPEGNPAVVFTQDVTVTAPATAGISAGFSWNAAKANADRNTAISAAGKTLTVNDALDQTVWFMINEPVKGNHYWYEISAKGSNTPLWSGAMDYTADSNKVGMIAASFLHNGQNENDAVVPAELVVNVWKSNTEIKTKPSSNALYTKEITTGTNPLAIAAVTPTISKEGTGSVKVTFNQDLLGRYYIELLKDGTSVSGKTVTTECEAPTPAVAKDTGYTFTDVNFAAGSYTVRVSQAKATEAGAVTGTSITSTPVVVSSDIASITTTDTDVTVKADNANHKIVLTGQLINPENGSFNVPVVITPKYTNEALASKDLAVVYNSAATGDKFTCATKVKILDTEYTVDVSGLEAINPQTKVVAPATKAETSTAIDAIISDNSDGNSALKTAVTTTVAAVQSTDAPDDADTVTTLKDAAKEEAVKITESQATTLKNDAVAKAGNGTINGVTPAADKVVLVTQSNLVVTVDNYEVDATTSNVTLTLDVSNVVRTVAHFMGDPTQFDGSDVKVKGDADVADNQATAVVVKEGVKKTVTQSVTFTVNVPATLIANNATNVWVKHMPEGKAAHYHAATADAGSPNTTTVLTITSTDGLSPFVIEQGATVAAKIGETGYVTLKAAIDAAKDGDIITLVSNNSEKITVTRAVSFTLDKDVHTFTGSITAGTGYKNEGSADNYKFVRDGGGTPTGGGGGVSSNVTIDRPTNGKVTVTPTAPSKGATVTINLTPDTGYAVGTVTVTDKDGKAVELTKVSDTKYTFTMPDGKVTVKATFTKVDTPPATGFTDVPADAYYADAVKWAVEKGITNGLTATTFGPNNSCTRGQMVTFLWRAAGSPAATGTNSFADVASGEYYYNAVLWAVEKGITNGTSATTFSPNATVNRGQTVTFLYRYAESPAATGDTGFTDVASDAFYADAVKWAVGEEITNGTSATTFAPSSNCTRGQIVTFMYRQMAE